MWPSVVVRLSRVAEKYLIPDYLWAKTTQNDEPAKTVLSHMNDVRAVAAMLLKSHERLLLKYGCDIGQITAFAGLHDIGKISPGFQSKCSVWLRKMSLEKIAKNFGWESSEKNHSKISQFTLQTMLQKSGMKTDSAELWAIVAGAHHGKLYKCINFSDDEWERKREEVVKMFLGPLKLPETTIEDSWPLLWWFAGIISVADWIGSAEDWFPVGQETTPAESGQNAVRAINAIGFDIPSLRKGLSFHYVFPFEPNDLQLKAAETIREPGLYIIEAPMGMGKTEAALWCVYRLMLEGKAKGMYFALPTQATSNQIHLRVNEFLGKITEGVVHSRLVHAGSWLLDDMIVPTLRSASEVENEAMREAIDWFASKKRGLLAPFGVGTIDQALMSVIAVKHFFVRQFALAEKVIILDEVHSYDLYTGTLIRTLCEQLLQLGCIVILLSATLTSAAKRCFVGAANEACEKQYPLITGTNIKPVIVQISELKTVKIQMKNECDALAEAFRKAKQGASVLWVCDTVNKAQQMFDCATLLNQEHIEIGLLHARFPFFRRKELEEYWMEKLGKEGKNRNGCILFSTQIVEQSVDLDADFMVSELAPTDMFLQRMGRLWRHKRDNRPVAIPEMWIVEEKYPFKDFREVTAKKIKEMLGSKSAVYAPYVLIRSLMLWKGIGSIKIPEDIRSLLERTYDPLDDEPKGWQDLFEEIEGDNFAKKQTAEFESNIWNSLLDDEEGKAKTRVNNYPMTQLILASQNEGNILHLLNGECIELRGDTFSLSFARSIHKNIVKIPAHCFKGKSTNEQINALVRGDWQVGFVKKDSIKCTYLKNDFVLRYTNEKGVEIVRADKKSGVDYEPCD